LVIQIGSLRISGFIFDVDATANDIGSFLQYGCLAGAVGLAVCLVLHLRAAEILAA
jgi:hypothetical protein